MSGGFPVLYPSSKDWEKISCSASSGATPGKIAERRNQHQVTRVAVMMMTPLRELKKCRFAVSIELRRLFTVSSI